MASPGKPTGPVSGTTSAAGARGGTRPGRMSTTTTSGTREEAFVPLKAASHAVKASQGGGTVQQVAGASGHHTYVVEEANAFAAHIDQVLRSDPAAAAGLEGHLPITGAADLFSKVSDGLLLCRLINLAQPDTIDERALNWPPGTAPTTTTMGAKRSVPSASSPGKPTHAARALNPFEMAENANMALSSARAIGCVVVNVHAADITGGTAGGKEHLVLGLVWQIVRAQLLARVNLKEHPELSRLLLPGETVKDFLALPPEEVLIRWVNWHLARTPGAQPASIANLGPDVRDARAYWHLLHSIDPTCLPAGGVNGDAHPTNRAAAVIQAAAALGAPSFIVPGDITSGNKRLNLAFTAALFNIAPGLAELAAEESAAVYEAAGMGTDSEADDREARQFRFWLNSLALPSNGPGSEPVYLDALFPALHDGLVLLHAIDKVACPPAVDWRKINSDKGRLNKWKEVENCNTVVAYGKALGFSLPGIAGSDINAGNPKLCLGFLWQLMRMQLMRMLTSMSGSAGGPAKDSDVLDWANSCVGRAMTERRCPMPTGATPPRPINSFRDPALSSGLYFLACLAAVEPRAIKADCITPGNSSEEKSANARYVLSAARKLGAVVFCTWEDLAEVQPKPVLQLLAGIMYRAKELVGGGGPGKTPTTTAAPTSTTNMPTVGVGMRGVSVAGGGSPGALTSPSK